MDIYFLMKHVSISEEDAFGLDESNVTTEKFPLVIAPVTDVNLTEVADEE